jgi:alcohol dehydrogenase class IV
MNKITGIINKNNLKNTNFIEACGSEYNDEIDHVLQITNNFRKHGVKEKDIKKAADSAMEDIQIILINMIRGKNE